MAIVTTLSTKGEGAKAYEIPDDELAKYSPVQGQSVEGESALAAISTEMDEAESPFQGDDDVQAYGHRCFCVYHTSRGRHVYVRWPCGHRCP